MIYIHIPYCRSFCTYCGFYSELAGRGCDQFDSFAKALCNEVGARHEEFGTEVNTLYLGGGTPSVLPLSALRQVISCLAHYGAKDFSEFTIEANPDDIVRKGADYVKALVDLGVNRVSMGVQSFDASVLRWMNRRHGPDDAVRAYNLLCEGGIANVSMDLIFGLGQQIIENHFQPSGMSSIKDMSREHSVVMSRWMASMEKMISLRPSHISAYQLSVEEGSVLETLASSGQWIPSSEEQSAQEYEYLCNALRKAGYHHYEISNFALAGYEARHNSAYWKHIPYTGLGPGAHSFRISGGEYIRQWNNPNLATYIDVLSKIDVESLNWKSQKSHCSESTDFSGITMAESAVDAISGMEVLDKEQIAIEKIMLALRTDSGIDLSYLSSKVGQGKLQDLMEAGLLVLVQPSSAVPNDCRNGSQSLDIGTLKERVRIPEDKFFISDSIISSLI